jgi:hypothetical protein
LPGRPRQPLTKVYNLQSIITASILPATLCLSEDPEKEKMKWVWDETHRFRMRPDYSIEELDAHCQSLIFSHLREGHGEVGFPIATDDLKSLLARDTANLDLKSDFTRESKEVEGLTEFRRGKKPSVKIAARLTESPSLENRLRTILAHEYGHVRFHDFLFQTEEGSSLSLFSDFPDSLPRTHRCERDSIFPLADRDWMEWQAGFVCGALLIPIGPLILKVREFRHARDLDHVALSDRSLDGAALIGEIAEKFQTSWAVARVRLLQERILTSGDMRSLF